MTTCDLTITEFIQHPDLLNDNTHSVSQNAILKSIHGDELTEDEMDAFRRGTGRQEYPGKEQKEASIIAGRRGGKTGKVAAPVAIYTAFCDHGLPRDERGQVMLIAPTLVQANIAFDYILKDLQSSRVLDAKIQKIRQNEVELRNRITIRCVPCSLVSVRGHAVVGAVLDEFAFFRNEETSLRCDKEVLNALRPAMIAFPHSKLIKITTPNGKRGEAWEEYSRRSELDYLVWQVSTMEMNPSIPTDELEKERQRDLQQFEREFGAVFTDSLVSWIEPEVLLPCIMEGRIELPRLEGVQYSACIDPAFQRSDFAMAISHRTSNGRIVLDYIGVWTGTARVPLAFGRVMGEIAEILRRYKITNVVGDQFCAAAIQNELGRLGISYKEMTFGRNTRAQLFNNLKHLILEQRIELLDHPKLLLQLKALEEERSPDGYISIRPAQGKDDIAVVVAMTASELSQPEVPASTITMGHVSNPWDDALALTRRDRDDLLEYMRYAAGYYGRYF